MNQFKTHVEWGDFDLAKQQHCYLNNLFGLLNTANTKQQSVADQLDLLAHKNGFNAAKLPQFVNQSELNNETRYYEQIIAELHQVPSRESSWHDFFNGIIWLQFPATKKLLNRLHVEQIQAFGLHPRTLVRNQVTHFDECGLVLVGTDPKAREIVNALKNHQWSQALMEEKGGWGSILHPIIFGHANLEMLLNPFMGLTAKWLYIECPQLEIEPIPSLENLALIDLALALHIEQNQAFASKGQLKPLPLMGIPGWYKNQNAEFYQQTSFFRPLNNNGKTLLMSPISPQLK